MYIEFTVAVGARTRHTISTVITMMMIIIIIISYCDMLAVRVGSKTRTKILQGGGQGCPAEASCAPLSIIKSRLARGGK